MHVERVSTASQLMEFVSLPYSLYCQDALWIPPLRSEQKKLFNPSKNSLLKQCDYQLFLCRSGKTVIGRSAAFIDHHYNSHWRENIGCFGSYECRQDSGAAAALLGACAEWLQQRGVDRMRGPISFETQNWGAILDDFTSPPRLMSPYNPPFYHDQFVAFGLTKVKDLHVFGVATQNYIIPGRFIKFRDHLLRKYNLRIRSIRMNKLIEDARVIVDLSNRSLAPNWGYTPVEVGEAENLAKDLKRIVWPELIKIAEADGRPIAFCITLPDILQLLKGTDGHLFPRALFRLLFKLRSIRVFRIWALGIIPEFQRRGIDTLLYLSLYEALKEIDAWVEANYILEDNFAMRDAVVKLGMKQVRTLRIYEKGIS